MISNEYIELTVHSIRTYEMGIILMRFFFTLGGDGGEEADQSQVIGNVSLAKSLEALDEQIDKAKKLGEEGKARFNALDRTKQVWTLTQFYFVCSL